MSYYGENPSLYYGNNGFSLSTKREVSKFVNIYRNGGYTILPDHPATESLSGISLNVNVINPCLKQGYNTFLVPAEPGQPDQQIIEVTNKKTLSVVASHLKNASFDYGSNVINTFDAQTSTVIDKILIITE